MTTGTGVLVVGAGQAAVQLASSLRDQGYTAPVTLVGEHDQPPYQRPPLSKAYLKRQASAASLAFRAPEFYEANDISVLLGESVVELERGSDGSGVALCGSGRRLSFDRLVLATGAQPRRIPLPGADAVGVHVLGTLDDAERLLEALELATDVVVIGGGFIGLEVAATAAALGKSVVVFEAEQTLMGRAVGSVTAAHVLALHVDAGLDVRLGTTVRSVVAEGGRVVGVALTDGTLLPAQVVLLAVGAAPRTELAEALGLFCENGIVVDQFSVTSDGVTLAIGDCAAVPDPTPHGDPSRYIRLESVDHAVEQAKAAASTIAGARQPYRSIPWFWSDQADVKLQMVGLRGPEDTVLVRKYDHANKLTVLYYRGTRLVAAETVNAPADFMTLKKALVAGVPIDREAARDVDVSLKSLLVAASAANPA